MVISLVLGERIEVNFKFRLLTVSANEICGGLKMRLGIEQNYHFKAE